MKKQSKKTLINKAWKLCSEYSRRKDTVNKYSTAQCVTCGETSHWQKMHAGHFMHGKSSLSWLYENNIHAQCPRCNKWLHGNLIEYTLYMKNRYGEEEIYNIKRMKNDSQTWNKSLLSEWIEYYNKKLKELDK